MWLNFLDKIYLVNLSFRTDRLLAATEVLEKYEIPHQRINAVHDAEQGARGLRDTMLHIFNDAIENNHENILVLEDDVVFVVDKEFVDATMNQVVKQLPPNYFLCYLGGQPTAGFPNFYSDNLLPAIQFFATHAVMYSKQGIKEIMTRGLGYPIDNWMVSNIQTQGNCYCTNPMLASQRPDKSDIGGQFISWVPFIDQRFQQKLNELHGRVRR